jgi:hypothetical protein
MGRRKGSPRLAPTKLGVYNLELLWKRADAIDLSRGFTYYTDFRKRLLACSDCSRLIASQVLGVYAALSPNNSEESNVKDMMVAARAFEAGWWDRLQVHTYGRNKEKAKRILDGEDPRVVLSGRKTRSFYENLLNPSEVECVTVDGHMVNVWNGARVPLDFAGITGSEYDRIERGVKELASRLGIVPCSLQSVFWLTWRRINGILQKPQYRLFDDCKHEGLSV